MADLQEAIGAYEMYKNIMAEQQHERVLYLAIPRDTYKGIFSEPLGQLMIAKEGLCLFVFDPKKEWIEQWIP